MHFKYMHNRHRWVIIDCAGDEVILRVSPTQFGWLGRPAWWRRSYIEA